MPHSRCRDWYTKKVHQPASMWGIMKVTKIPDITGHARPPKRGHADFWCRKMFGHLLVTCWQKHLKIWYYTMDWHQCVETRQRYLHSIRSSRITEWPKSQPLSNTHWYQIHANPSITTRAPWGGEVVHIGHTGGNGLVQNRPPLWLYSILKLHLTLSVPVHHRLCKFWKWTPHWTGVQGAAFQQILSQTPDTMDFFSGKNTRKWWRHIKTLLCSCPICDITAVLINMQFLYMFLKHIIMQN